MHGGILFVFVPQAEMGSHAYLLHDMPVKRKNIYTSVHIARRIFIVITFCPTSVLREFALKILGLQFNAFK